MRIKDLDSSDLMFYGVEVYASYQLCELSLRELGGSSHTWVGSILSLKSAGSLGSYLPKSRGGSGKIVYQKRSQKCPFLLIFTQARLKMEKRSPKNCGEGGGVNIDLLLMLLIQILPILNSPRFFKTIYSGHLQ